MKIRKANQIKLNLLPEHLADLRKSGLNDETILREGLFSIQGSDLPLFVGKAYPSVKSALVFPYGQGFFRLKLFPALKTTDGKTIRYLQPAKTQPRFYVPKSVESYLHDPQLLLYITEGEKKALAGCQHGLPTIAISGLWSWLAQGCPIDDFNLIAWKGRRVVFIGDSDVWLPNRPDLQKAIFALCKEIESRGAFVDLIVLSQGVEK